MWSAKQHTTTQPPLPRHAKPRPPIERTRPRTGRRGQCACPIPWRRKDGSSTTKAQQCGARRGRSPPASSLPRRQACAVGHYAKLWHAYRRSGRSRRSNRRACRPFDRSRHNTTTGTKVLGIALWLVDCCRSRRSGRVCAFRGLPPSPLGPWLRPYHIATCLAARGNGTRPRLLGRQRTVAAGGGF